MAVGAFNIIERSNPVAKLIAARSYEGQRGQPPDADTDAKINALDMNTWVHVAAHTIGKNLSAAPLLVEQRITVDGKLEWQPQESGPLAELLASPNPQEPQGILVWKTVLALETAGNAYWAKDAGGKELWFLHPSWVTIVSDPVEGVIGYIVKRNGKEVAFEKDEIIHFPMPGIREDYYGSSPTQVNKLPILTEHYADQDIKDYYKNGAIPTGALSTDQGGDEKIASATRKEWEKIHKGVGNKHKIAVLFNGLKFDSITPPIKELVVPELSKKTREQILAPYGLPPVFAGIFDQANYANSKEQVKMFWQNVVLPIQRIIAEILNLQLAPQYGDNLRVRFDTSQIEALQEDQNEKATRSVQLYTGGITTLNESRILMGLEAVGDGDAFRTSLLAGMFESADDETEDDPDSKRVRVYRAKSPGDAARILHDKFLTVKEKKFAKVMSRYFDGQLDRLLANINEVTGNGKALASLRWMLTRDDEPSPGDVAALFDMEIEGLALRSATAPLMISTILEAGEMAIDQYGLGIAFDVDNPQVIALIESLGNRIGGINNKTFRTVKSIIKNAYDSGAGVGEIEKQLREQFSMFSRSRSKVIARTEMNGVVNGGSHAAYEQSGVEKKGWLSTFDSETRDAHVHADGEVVRIGEPFIMTGEPLRFPGDPSGSPYNTINCRCTTEPKID